MAAKKKKRRKRNSKPKIRRAAAAGAPSPALTRTEKRKAIQRILDVAADGIIGPITQSAWNALWRADVIHKCKASSFADPKDIEAFRRCKAGGGTDQECFKVGDNGIGYWGDDTTGASPCCALHRDHIIEMWGSLANGKHKPVEVTIVDKTVTCILKDICGIKERVDLNPGACAAFGLKPQVLVYASWRWA